MKFNKVLIIYSFLFFIILGLLFATTQHPQVNKYIVTIIPLSQSVVIPLRLCLIVTELIFATLIFYVLAIKENTQNKLWENGCLSVFTTIIFLLICEGSFMFVAKSHSAGDSIASSIWFNRYWKPINTFSFRDKEIEFNELKGKKRVIFLGDSLTAGYGIKNIKDRFSDILRSKFSSRYFVFNMGVNGASSRSEFRTLYVLPFKPHVLVLEYFPNDIIGAKGFTEDKIDYIPYADIHPILRFIVMHSYLANYIYWQLPHQNLTSQFTQMMKAYNQPDILYNHLRDLSRFAAYKKENSFKMIVVIIPFLNIDFKDQEFLSNIQSYLEFAGIPTIDMRPLLQEIPVAKRVVNNNDAHPSVLVHNIIADAVYKKLVELNYIDPQN